MLDLAPTRESLKAMEKKSTESFKEYAQRWRDLASQVQPPLEEKEISVTFVYTLKDAHFERLFSLATESFSKIVVVREMLESGLKSGRISGTKDHVETSKKGQVDKRKEKEANIVEHRWHVETNKKGQVDKMKEKEANIVEHRPYQPRARHGSYHPPPFNYGSPYPTPNYYQPPYSPYPNLAYYTNHVVAPPFKPGSTHDRPETPYPQNASNTQNTRRPPREKQQIDHIPYTYTELLPQLLQQGLLEKLPFMKPLPFPYPPKYDPSATVTSIQDPKVTQLKIVGN